MFWCDGPYTRTSLTTGANCGPFVPIPGTSLLFWLNRRKESPRRTRGGNSLVWLVELCDVRRCNKGQLSVSQIQGFLHECTVHRVFKDAQVWCILRCITGDKQAKYCFWKPNIVWNLFYWLHCKYISSMFSLFHN